jgi:hypothetical protein
LEQEEELEQTAAIQLFLEELLLVEVKEDLAVKMVNRVDLVAVRVVMHLLDQVL